MSDSPVLITDIQLRYGDLDTLGHVNNAVYLTYFELGRVLFFRKYLREFDVNSIAFVIARAEINFRKSIRITDDVLLETRIEDVGNTSFNFGHRLVSRDGKTVFCEGKIVAVSIDKDRKPCRVPEEIRNLVSA